MNSRKYNLDETRTVAQIVIKCNEYCSDFSVDKMIEHMLSIANSTYPEYKNECGYVATMGFVASVCNDYIKFSVDGWLIESYIKSLAK
jgi:hypothetical protein